MLGASIAGSRIAVSGELINLAESHEEELSQPVVLTKCIHNFESAFCT